MQPHGLDERQKRAVFTDGTGERAARSAGLPVEDDDARVAAVGDVQRILGQEQVAGGAEGAGLVPGERPAEDGGLRCGDGTPLLVVQIAAAALGRGTDGRAEQQRKQHGRCGGPCSAFVRTHLGVAPHSLIPEDIIVCKTFLCVRMNVTIGTDIIKRETAAPAPVRAMPLDTIWLSA